MALTAVVAAWAVAVAAAWAAGGHRVGGVAVPPAAYALGLAGVAAFAAVAPPRRPVALPERWRPVAGGALVLGALYLFSGDGGAPAPGLASLPALAGLLVPATAVLWPRPAALRASVALGVLSLLAPGASPTAHPAALAALAAGAAVVLVTTTRMAASAGPALAGRPVAVSPRRVGGEAAAVAAVLAVAAVASTLVDAPPRPSPARAGEAPSAPREREPAPLAFDDVLDPAAAGRGATGEGNDVLLRIDAPRAEVWRAVTYGAWDGRRWRRSPSAGRRLARSGARFVPVPGAPFRAGPARDSTQHVRVEAAYAEVAVGAPEVRYLEVPGGAAVGADGSVRLVPPLGRGAAYVAHTARAVTTEAELRAAEAAPPAAEPDLLHAGALSERARALAARVTAGAPTAYDRVRALERWLDDHVAVEDEAPALPGGADPVDEVLFTRRAGSPEGLATALALLARAAGVPARLAVGFLPGERPPLGGRFVVRARHAHAWVEVPFTGLGWQRFDPTGRIARAEAADSLAERLRRLLARWWAVLAAVALAAAGAAVALALRRRRRRRAAPWEVRCFARLTRLGAERGRPRRPSETPAEYADALATGVLGDRRVSAVGQVVTAAAWSERPPDDEVRRWADEVLAEVAAATAAERYR